MIEVLFFPNLLDGVDTPVYHDDEYGGRGTGVFTIDSE